MATATAMNNTTNFMNTEALTLTSEEPAAALDLTQIKVYPGESVATAQYELDKNLKIILEREETLKLKRLFIQKHNETLAGLDWQVGYLDTEIEICKRYYRGATVGPTGVAKLWPQAKWTRVKPKYSSQPAMDWIAVVDGVTLRIKDAETWEPLPTPRDGTPVAL